MPTKSSQKHPFGRDFLAPVRRQPRPQRPRLDPASEMSHFPFHIGLIRGMSVKTVSRKRPLVSSELSAK